MAFATNALIRMLIEDDAVQVKIVEVIINCGEENAGKILLMSEVLIETVWALESVYQCSSAFIIVILMVW